MKCSLPHYRRSPAELPKLEDLILTQAPSTTRSVAIQTVLRRTALENRRDHLQPFYSIRAVADHFDVPPATVSRIYRQLSIERILRLVWGSKTLLEPIDSLKKSEQRPIGIVVDLRRFTSSPSYQHSILNLQRELSNHDVIDHLLFFENSGEEILHLCKQHRFHAIDTLIWFSPESSQKNVLLRLHDKGVCVICFGDHPISGLSDFYMISSKRTAGRIIRERILKIP